MFHRMDAEQLNTNDTVQWAASLGNLGVAIATTLVDLVKPDVFLFFGDTRTSDRIKRIAYHEIAHVSQYTKFDPDWRKENIY